MEYFDVYDEEIRSSGVASKSEVLEKGLWCRSIHVWILNTINNKVPCIIFQLRSPEKKVYPNKLDISAAGHLSQGEEPKDGVREIKEELGLDIPYENLIPMGIRTEVAKIDDKIVREFCETFLLKNDMHLKDYRLQEDEVSALVEIPVEEGLKLFTNEKNVVNARGVRLIKDNFEEFEMEVSQDSVIPRKKDYFYYKIFLMADLYLKGLKKLAI